MESPKPVLVFFNLLPDTLEWIFSKCADDFVKNEGYTIIANEVLEKKDQQLSAPDLLTELEKAIATLKKIRTKNPLHQEQINLQILKHEQSIKAILPFSKNSSVTVHSIDTALGKFKNVLLQFSNLVESTLAVRDEVLADNLEKLRQKNPTTGIIVNIELIHFGVKNFLLKKYGKDGIQNYRFYYCHSKKELSTEMFEKVQGLCVLNCIDTTPQAVYQQIKDFSNTIISSELPKEVLTELSLELDKKLSEAQKHVPTIKRLHFVMDFTIKYLNHHENGLESNALFFLICMILTQFNEKNVSYDVKIAKIKLANHPNFISAFKIPNEAISHYQKAVDSLIPKIQSKFKSQKLNDPDSQNFLNLPKPTSKNNWSAWCKHYGFFSLSLAVAAAGVATAALYYVNNDEINNSIGPAP